MFHRHSHARHSCHDRRFARAERGQGGPQPSHGLHRGPGRSGLGRFFAHGDLRLVILYLIAEKPRHGYEIIKAIEDRVAGAYSPSPGVIYPTLTLLEELGYVTVARAGDGSRQAARDHRRGPRLPRRQPAPRSTRCSPAWMRPKALHGGGPAPQLARAMENLKLALKLRLATAR